MRSKSTAVEVEGHTLELSNLDKVLYPEVGFTKAQVIDYYRQIAPVLVPHLAGRPLTLKRYPNGVAEKSFYEKNAPAHRPAWVRTTKVWSKHNDRDMQYVVTDDLATLMWTANLAALELHVSLARGEALDRPTAVVFDLDPGPPADILDCAEVALWLRTILDGVGLLALPKTSGKKGLQIYVPLDGAATFDDTKRFAHAIAQQLERDHPQRVLSVMKRDLRGGKIFVDWSQNDQHKTTVSVYSLRAEPTPTVSTPVTWKELESALRKRSAEALRFDAPAVLGRVAKHGDLFAPLLTLRQSLPGAEAQKPHLEEYRRKRDFTVTPEPAGDATVRSDEHPSYMIHKHHATRLHYDLRLEMDGALASWAIPKGPTNDPSVKRLAVQTEDHPLEYGEFEGRIPDGEYGGGDSLIWDRGLYDTLPPGQASQQRKKGHLHLVFAGAKLQGEFHLIRTRDGASAKAQWLFFRAKTADQPVHAGELVDDHPESVVSGRRVTRGPEKKGALKGPHPAPDELLDGVFPPMLATLDDALPPGDWIAELKYDGFRALAGLSGGNVALWSRNRLDLAPRFPGVAAELEKIVVGEAVVDGEIVAIDDQQRVHFDRMGEGNEAFIAFDLLHLDGRDLRGEPIETRRELLESLLSGAPERIRLSERVEISSTMVADSARRGFEGVVAKRAGSTYEAKRSAAWIKLKAVHQQELAIIGYTLKTGDPRRIGALLLGVVIRGAMHFAGRVGTGFSEKLRAELLAQLMPDRSEKSAACDAPRLPAAVWVEPRLVAEVRFTEWTKDGKLRHPSFVRVRPDKIPTECTRE